MDKGRKVVSALLAISMIFSNASSSLSVVYAEDTAKQEVSVDATTDLSGGANASTGNRAVSDREDFGEEQEVVIDQGSSGEAGFSNGVNEEVSHLALSVENRKDKVALSVRKADGSVFDDNESLTLRTNVDLEKEEKAWVNNFVRESVVSDFRKDNEISDYEALTLEGILDVEGLTFINDFVVDADENEITENLVREYTLTNQDLLDNVDDEKDLHVIAFDKDWEILESKKEDEETIDIYKDKEDDEDDKIVYTTKKCDQVGFIFFALGEEVSLDLIKDESQEEQVAEEVKQTEQPVEENAEENVEENIEEQEQVVNEDSDGVFDEDSQQEEVVEVQTEQITEAKEEDSEDAVFDENQETKQTEELTAFLEETEAEETEAVETEAVETEAEETEAVETEAVETEAEETEAVETEAIETETEEVKREYKGREDPQLL